MKFKWFLLSMIGIIVFWACVEVATGWDTSYFHGLSVGVLLGYDTWGIKIRKVRKVREEYRG